MIINKFMYICFVFRKFEKQIKKTHINMSVTNSTRTDSGVVFVGTSCLV